MWLTLSSPSLVVDSTASPLFNSISHVSFHFPSSYSATSITCLHVRGVQVPQGAHHSRRDMAHAVIPLPGHAKVSELGIQALRVEGKTKGEREGRREGGREGWREEVREGLREHVSQLQPPPHFLPSPSHGPRRFLQLSRHQARCWLASGHD